MKRLIIVSVLAVVLLLGYGLSSLKAGTLSVEEMNKIVGGWEIPSRAACVGTANCGSYTSCPWWSTYFVHYFGGDYRVCSGVDYPSTCSNSGGHTCGIEARYQLAGCNGALVSYGFIIKSCCG